MMAYLAFISSSTVIFLIAHNKKSHPSYKSWLLYITEIMVLSQQHDLFTHFLSSKVHMDKL